MLFESADDYVNAERHAVTVFGMAGAGKTRLASRLRWDGWFHFSVDYRIGTRYMGDYIVDHYKHEAMKVPLLAELLRNDSIYICSNITFDNLEPLSAYLGLPGNPDKGGLPLAEYQRRQEQHRKAEILAVQDVPYFIERAKSLYGYDDFIVDSGGSLIEVIDLDDPDDATVKTLTEHTVLVYIEDAHERGEELVSRFRANPKPMYYRPALLVDKWAEFKALHSITRDDDVDPAEFGAFGFEAIMADRSPRYEALARRHGYTVGAADLASVRDSADFNALMRKAISRRKAA